MNRSYRILWMLVLFLAVPSSVAAVPRGSDSAVYSDQIVVYGKVEIWSLENAQGTTMLDKDLNYAEIPGGAYIPARNIYIESNYFTISMDPNGYTNQFGEYWLKKSALVEGTYDVNVEVRANTILGTYGGPLLPSKVTVSIYNDTSDLYSVNGKTSDHSYQTGNSYQLDIHIGGPQNNIAEWWDDTYWDYGFNLKQFDIYKVQDNSKGIHPVVTFWMTQVLLDYYHQVTHLALKPNQIKNDTWIIYPAIDDENSHYAAWSPPPGVATIDIARRPLFPSQFQDELRNGSNIGQAWQNFRRTLYHEYSHKIMHDVYWAMPNATPDSLGWNESGHAIDTCKNQELAWKEGFAEFLPAAVMGFPTVNADRGGYNLEHSFYPEAYLDYKNCILAAPATSAGRADTSQGCIQWHIDVQRTCIEPRNNEGEVAAALWDIFDGEGWEFLPFGVQSTRPLHWLRPFMWYDRLSDPYLENIWSELRNNSPDSINDEGDIRLDSFWTDWLKKYNNNNLMIHGLKAILFNRGISTTSKPENTPKVTDIVIDVPTRKLNIKLTEDDPEDREFLYLNVGYQKEVSEDIAYYFPDDKLLKDFQPTWQGNQASFNVDIPRGKLGQYNLVMVHDSMLVHYRGQNVHPDETLFPLQCSTQKRTNQATAVAVQGNYAYMTDMDDGLYVYDINDPLQPRQVAFLAADVNSETPWGGAMDVVVSGSYAYIASISGALVTVDISNPANPILQGYIELPGQPRGVALSGRRVFVANTANKLAVVNIFYPNTPWLETMIDIPGESFSVAATGSHIFVAAGDGGLQIMANGLFPRLLGGIPTPPGDRVTGVAVDSNGLIYYTSDLSGLHVVDISTWDPVLANLSGFMNKKVDPEVAYPVEIDHLALEGTPGRMAIDGATLYIAQDRGVGAYDINLPELIYQMSFSNAVYGANDVAFKGPVVYVASGTGGLVVLSRTTQAQGGCSAEDGSGSGTLEKIGAWDGSVRDMTFSGNYAYIAAWEEGLHILDIQDPANIKLVSTYNQSLDDQHKLNASGIDVVGSKAYLSSVSGDLHFLDVSRPENPARFDITDMNLREDVGSWSEVKISADYGYVCSGKAGVREIYVGLPRHYWGNVMTNALTDCTDIAATDLALYALGSSSGLFVFRVDERDRLTQTYSWKLPEGGPAGNVYQSIYLDEAQNRLYVAAHFKGVYIFDVSDPLNPRLVGSIDPGIALDVASSGNYAFVGDAMVVHLIDVRNPAVPVEIGSVPLSEIPDLEISAMKVAVHGDYLYVATDRHSLIAYRIQAAP